MLRLTWEWIGIDEPALDVANTVAIENGVERDFLEQPGEYERWAAAAANSHALSHDEAAAIVEARAAVLALRTHIRSVSRRVCVGGALRR